SLTPAEPCALLAYAGQTVELAGTVLGEEEAQGNGLAFPLQVEALRLAGAERQEGQGTVLVQGERFLEVAYGDRLVLRGKLVHPQSGGTFSYRDYLARQGICALLQKVQVVERLPGSGGFWGARLLYGLRSWARQRLEGLFPEPQASLLVGILLGTRAGIPSEVQEAFSRSGTSHILAISGWNISIVAAFLAAAGRYLPRRLSPFLVASGILLYTLFVGAGAAVLRAALMGLLYVLARHVGRPGHGPTALMAAAWAMTLWNPLLLWDTSFQLSFSATLGMLMFVPVWTELLSRWPPFLAESLSATLASQLLTWPLMAFYFRQFSLVVPLANLLACPALPPLMLLGTLALLLGALPGLGAILQGLTWLVASYMLGVVEWSGALPWAALPLPPLGVGFLVMYYVCIGWWYRSHRAASCPKAIPK
ncbi:MAG: ComEC/Rec2 family competence protein, partial [Chloroflexia bacterium]